MDKDKKKASEARTKKSSNYFGILVAVVVIKVFFFDGDFKFFSDKVSKYDLGSGKELSKAVENIKDIADIGPILKVSQKNSDNSFQGVKYIKNYDGDTITFSNVGDGPSIISESMSVRVAGIDTPEIKGKNQCEKTKALAAKKIVEKILTAADRIDLIDCKKGKYFRLVCMVVAIKGKYSVDIAQVLKKEGLANSYDGGTKKETDWCLTKKQPLK